MAAARTPSSTSSDTLDALFASADLHAPEPAITSGKRLTVRKTRKVFSARCEDLEPRIVQSADSLGPTEESPAMGPEEDPVMMRKHLDIFTASLAALQQDIDDAEDRLAHLETNHQGNVNNRNAALQEHDDLLVEQALLEQSTEDLQTRIDALDARAARLQAHPEEVEPGYSVNWFQEGMSTATVPGTQGKESMAMAISRNGTFIARGDRAGTTQLIDAKTGSVLLSVSLSSSMWDLSFDVESNRLVALDNKGILKVIDVHTFAVKTFSVPNDNYFGNVQFQGNEVLVSMQEFGVVRAVNIDTGAVRAIKSIGATNGVAPVGTDAIFVGGTFGPLAVYSLQGTLLAEAPSPGPSLTIAASPDGSLLAVATWFGTVKVYDRSLRELGQATGSGHGYRMSFLPENKGLVVFDADGRLLIYDFSNIQNGSLGAPTILSTNGSQGPSNTMGIAPDGSLVFNIDPNNGIRATALPAAVRVSSAQKKIEELETERAALVQSLHTAKTALTNTDRLLTILADNLKNLETLCVESVTLVSNMQSALVELERNKDALIANIQALQTRLDALDATASAEEESDLQSLASALAVSVQATLDSEANAIRYPRITVSRTTIGNDTLFRVRFRNPGPTSYMEVLYDQGEGFRPCGGPVADAPIADGLYEFTIRGVPDASGDSVIFRLKDGETHALLTQIQGNYNGPVQDFAIDEAGMLAENPITPSLTVGRMSGPTLLFVVQTPHDQFYIDTDMTGLLSTAEGSSTGGTTFGLAQITVDTGRPTGYHTIRLYDRKGGQVIDTVTISFDQGSRTISLVDPAEAYSGSTSIEETDLAQTQQAMQALQNIPLGVGHADIARNQRLHLYYQTTTLAAPYNLYIDANRMLEMVFAMPQYIKYADANLRDTIQKQWDSMGTYEKDGALLHYYNYDDAQDIVVRSKRQLQQDFMSKLAVYEQAMSECMQSAVNLFLGILQGQPEEPMRQRFDELYRTWSENGIVRSLTSIGMFMPNSWILRMAAKEVFYKEWEYLVQTQEDVMQVRDREEYFLQQGLLKKANGEWEAASDRNNPTPVPAGLNATELRLATKINIAMQNSAQLFARYTPEQRSRIISTITALLGDNPTESDIVSSTLVAMNTVDSDLRSASLDLDTSLFTIDAINASNTIQSIGQAVLFNRAMRWFNESNGSLRSVFPIRTDSTLGKMMYAGSEELFESQTNEGRWEIAFTLQRLTDIPGQKFIDVLIQSHGSEVDFCSAMQGLLIKAQYEELFPEHPRYFESPIFTGADPDIPASVGAYTDDRPEIRIRFDLVPTDKKMQKLEVISRGKVIATTTGAAFVKFGMLSVGNYGDNIHVTLRATFTDGTSIETESSPFNLHPGVSTLPKGFDQILSGVPENMKATVSEALNINLNNLPTGNIKLLQHFIDAYLKNGVLHFDSNALGQVFELEGQMYGTANDQCKAWLQKIFVPGATSSNTTLPVNIQYDANGNAIVSYEWVMNTPDSNGRILSSDGKIEQIAAIRSNATTFESMISSNAVQEGDIVQMAYGSTQHTMVLWKKETTGIWVFDTNFGDYGEPMLPDSNHDAEGILDENGKYHKLTLNEIAAGVVPKYWYQSDNTIRLHFLSYTDLNSKTSYATTYRIQ